MIKERLVLKKKVKQNLTKLLITIIIFQIGLICIKKDISIKSIIEKNIYEKSFSFIKPKSLYKKYIGTIIPINTNENTKEVINEKINYINKVKYKNGVKLTVNDNYLVPALESGVIIYVGLKDNLNNTIIIEQTDGVETIYSNININDYKLYDYIEKGEYLGSTISNNLILQFTKNGEYIDYKKYI